MHSNDTYEKIKPKCKATYDLIKGLPVVFKKFERFEQIEPIQVTQKRKRKDKKNKSKSSKNVLNRTNSSKSRILGMAPASDIDSSRFVSFDRSRLCIFVLFYFFFCFVHVCDFVFSENIDLDNIGFVGNKDDELFIDQTNLKKKKEKKRKKQLKRKKTKKSKNSNKEQKDWNSNSNDPNEFSGSELSESSVNKTDERCVQESCTNIVKQF